MLTFFVCLFLDKYQKFEDQDTLDRHHHAAAQASGYFTQESDTDVDARLPPRGRGDAR